MMMMMMMMMMIDDWWWWWWLMIDDWWLMMMMIDDDDWWWMLHLLQSTVAPCHCQVSVVRKPTSQCVKYKHSSCHVVLTLHSTTQHCYTTSTFVAWRQTDRDGVSTATCWTWCFCMHLLFAVQYGVSTRFHLLNVFVCFSVYLQDGSVAEWLVCWTRVQ